MVTSMRPCQRCSGLGPNSCSAVSQGVPGDAVLGVEVAVDGLEHLPGLVVVEVRAHLVHVVDAPDMGDLAVLGEQLVDVDVELVLGGRDRGTCVTSSMAMRVLGVSGCRGGVVVEEVADVDFGFHGRSPFAVGWARK